MQNKIKRHLVAISLIWFADKINKTDVLLLKWILSSLNVMHSLFYSLSLSYCQSIYPLGTLKLLRSNIGFWMSWTICMLFTSHLVNRRAQLPSNRGSEVIVNYIQVKKVLFSLKKTFWPKYLFLVWINISINQDFNSR